jgi:hypothetical protein
MEVSSTVDGLGRGDDPRIASQQPALASWSL